MIRSWRNDTFRMGRRFPGYSQRTIHYWGEILHFIGILQESQVRSESYVRKHYQKTLAAFVEIGFSTGHESLPLISSLLGPQRDVSCSLLMTISSYCSAKEKLCMPTSNCFLVAAHFLCWKRLKPLRKEYQASQRHSLWVQSPLKNLGVCLEVTASHTLQMLTCLFFIDSLWLRAHHPHFTDEKTEIRKLTTVILLKEQSNKMTPNDTLLYP